MQRTKRKKMSLKAFIEKVSLDLSKSFKTHRISFNHFRQVKTNLDKFRPTCDGHICINPNTEKQKKEAS